MVCDDPRLYCAAGDSSRSSGADVISLLECGLGNFGPFFRPNAPNHALRTMKWVDRTLCQESGIEESRDPDLDRMGSGGHYLRPRAEDRSLGHLPAE